MKDSIKKFWAWITTPVRKFSNWAGGEDENRNLFGSFLDLTWGAVTLPLLIVWGTGQFLVFLFKEPKKATVWLGWQAARIGKALGALLHVAEQQDRVLHINGQRIVTQTWRVDVERVYLVVCLWFLAGTFGIILAGVGLGAIVPWLMGVCLVAFFVTGIPKMKAVWNEATFEDWVAKTKLREQQETRAVIRERMQTTEDLRTTAEDVAELARNYQAIMQEQAAARAHAADVERQLTDAKAELARLQLEHKQEGGVA